MTAPLYNLSDFAERLRVHGTYQEAEFAVEILDNLDFVENANFDELTDEITHHTKDVAGGYVKQVEWLNNRSHLLDEICGTLTEHGLSGDADDEIREALEILRKAKEILADYGRLSENGNFLDVLTYLADNAPFDL